MTNIHYNSGKKIRLSDRKRMLELLTDGQAYDKVRLLEENYLVENAHCDVIVNASNGSGYMGGKKSARVRCHGVAESLNFKTKGAIEKEARIAARRYKNIPASLFGHKAGTVFFTSSCGLDCKEVFHAVTVRRAGDRSKMYIIARCLEAIFTACEEKGYKSVAIPLLGAGTGGLPRDKVIDLILFAASYHPDIKAFIADYSYSEVLKTM